LGGDLGRSGAKLDSQVWSLLGGEAGVGRGDRVARIRRQARIKYPRDAGAVLEVAGDGVTVAYAATGVDEFTSIGEYVIFTTISIPPVKASNYTKVEVNGTLTIMVGGDPASFERATPLFAAIGKAWVLVGDAGAGQIAKACNQIIVGAQMVALAEALITAQKAGVDPARVIEAIKGGAAQMWTLDVKPPRLFAGNRAPGFKAYMQHKDLGIIIDTGRAYDIPLPLTELTHRLYTAMLEQGNRELDNSAVISVYESLAGLHLDEPLKP